MSWAISISVFSGLFWLSGDASLLNGSVSSTSDNDGGLRRRRCVVFYRELPLLDFPLALCFSCLSVWTGCCVLVGPCLVGTGGSCVFLGSRGWLGVSTWFLSWRPG
ncbi:hypothetical protein U1Q18_008446 [Sarracenia purpurea var. burkii]